MRTTVNGLRDMLFVGAAIFGAIALAMAALVIPPVLADTFPRASPRVAAIALAVNAGLNFLAGLWVFFLARRLSESGPKKAGNLPVVGLLAIVLDLLLLDAADDFSAHGPALAPAVTWLFVVSVSGVLSGILLIVSAARLSKQHSKAIEQPLRRYDQVRKLWQDIRGHRLAVLMFLVYWIATLVVVHLTFNRGIPPAVLLLLFTVPLLAGILVGWWRSAGLDHKGRSGEEAGGGMLAGCLCALITIVVMKGGVLDEVQGYLRGLPHYGQWGEAAGFLIVAGLVGFVLGLIGAALGSRMADRRHQTSGSH